jgi:hypothetical protein
MRFTGASAWLHRTRTRWIVVAAVTASLLVAGLALLAADSNQSPHDGAGARLKAAREVNPDDFPVPSRRTTLRHLAFSLIAGPKIGLQHAGPWRTGERLRFTLTRGPRRHAVVAPTVLYIAAHRDAPASGPFPAPAEAGGGSGTVGSPVYSVRLPRFAPGHYSIIAATRDGDDLLGDWTDRHGADTGGSELNRSPARSEGTALLRLRSPRRFRPQPQRRDRHDRERVAVIHAR